MLSVKVKMEIMKHAEDDYPNECCGLVTQKGRVQRYHRIKNVHPAPTLKFEMDAVEYDDVNENNTVIAVVHSHTGEGATTMPSAHDTCICNEMMIPWVIVSIPEGDMRILQPDGDAPLTGRPFSLGSYDCFGLVMDWHKRHGVILKDRRVGYEWWKPEYPDDLYRQFWQEDGFIETGQRPQVGDMVIMQIQSQKWNHAGIYMGDNQLLHHISGRLSKHDIYSGWLEEHTVLICRHKDLKL